LAEVQAAGYGAVVIEGDGDIAEICQLTCLEFGLRVADGDGDQLPRIAIREYELDLVWPGEDPAPGENGA
jgi:hypothetical protein